MSRIDAQVAMQVGEVIRPVQSLREGQLQAQAARTRQQLEAQDGSALAVDDAPDPSQVRSAMAQVKQVIETASGRQIDVGVDETGKVLLVKVLGSKGEVLRQIPSKEVLELRDRIDSIIGLLFDEEA